MKITHNKVGQNLNVRDTAKADKADKTKAASSGEIAEAKSSALSSLSSSEATKVDLSSRSQDIKRAKEIALATPEINEEKVARLQKLIDEGKYDVSAKDVADKMVDEQLSWE